MPISIRPNVEATVRRAPSNAALRQIEPTHSLRDRQREETRLAIINGAIQLFSQRGFEGTGLPAIAAVSGIAVPLMLYHFKSKDLLWREAVNEVYRRVVNHLQGYKESLQVAEGIEFYRLCARAHITALATYPEYMRILFQEGTWPTERLAWLVETHQSKLSLLIEQILARAQHEQLLPAMDLRHAKFIFSGAFCFPIVLAAEFKQLTGQDSQSEEFIERHIEMCLRLMLPGYPDSAKPAPPRSSSTKRSGKV